MSRIEGKTRIARVPEVTYRDLEDGGVLLHLTSGAYHGVNNTGAAIWKLLESEPRLEELVERLGQQVTDPPSDLRQEVEGFVTALRDRGLILLRDN